MIAQLIVGGHGTMMQLGLRMSILTLTIAGAFGILILVIPGVSEPDQIGDREYAVASLACVSFAAFTLLFLYTTIFDRWESRFDTMPWSDSILSVDGESGRRPSAFSVKGAPCPFTGLPSSMRCPCCKAAVHASAFHRSDKNTEFIVGEVVLKWDLATAALEKQDSVVESRIELDEALDFNGNILFGAVGNACIGCTAWQKSFNVMARWSLTLACMGQCFCWAPWAFEGSIATLHDAKGLRWTILLLALFYSLSALAIESRRLLLATIFQTRYAHIIKFPRVITLPIGGWRRRMLKFFAGETEWSGMDV